MEPELLSWYIVTRPGMSGGGIVVVFPVGQEIFLYVVQSVQTDSGMHPATYLMDTEAHSRCGA